MSAPRIRTAVPAPGADVVYGTAYCSAYIGPFMWFTEMDECHTEFTVPEPECVEDRMKWAPCPRCGADCVVEWPEPES